MSYSIIIPSKSEANLRACVHPIIFWKHDHEEIRVAWDQRTPDPLNGMRFDISSRILYRVMEPPFIYAKSINRGLENLPRGGVILLNDDAILETPGGFDLLHGIARANREYGAIAPVVLGQVGQAQQRQRWRNPAACEGTSFQGLRCPLIREAAPKTWLNFVCVYLTEQALEVLHDGSGHWLDERFGGTDENGDPIYGGDDVDACYRLRQAGLKLGITDHVVVEHGSTFNSETQRFGSEVRSSFRTHEDGSYRKLSTAASNKLFEAKWGFLPGER